MTLCYNRTNIQKCTRDVDASGYVTKHRRLDMKSITLTMGKVAQVSDHRFTELNKRKWRAHWNGWNWHAATTINGKNVYLHRYIMGVTDSRVIVDHKDGDGLNCQDGNLRICTTSQNGMNRGKQSDNKSGYKGVCWDKNKRKWMATIKLNQKNIFLGRFDNPIDAAKAYDEGARKYHGPFARLNFEKKG
jgi:hypothetical protein